MPGLRYAIAEGGLISIIIPDDDAELDRVPLGPGQALLKVTAKQLAQNDPQALVTAHTGKVPPDGAHAIVDKATGAVVDTIHVYPSIWPLDEKYEFVSSRKARKGDVYLDGKRTDDDIDRIINEKVAAEIAAVNAVTEEEI